MVYKKLLRIIAATLLAIYSLNAQNITAEDTLKIKIIAKRVNDNTSMIRLIPGNESSLIFAQQPTMLSIVRYTLTQNGDVMDENSILNSKVEFQLSPLQESEFSNKASEGEEWDLLYHALYRPDFDNNQAANILGVSNSDDFTRLKFSEAMSLSSFEKSAAQGLAIIDGNTDFNESYAYFLKTKVPDNDIYAQFGVYGFVDEQIALSGDGWNQLWDKTSEIENLFRNNYGTLEHNIIKSRRIFNLPNISPIIGSNDGYIIKIQINNIDKTFLSNYKIERKSQSDNNWNIQEERKVYNTLPFEQEVPENNQDYQYRIIASSGFYQNYLNSTESNILTFKISEPKYKPDEFPYKIGVRYENAKDTLRIRWTPLNYDTWLLGNKKGYYIERIKIKENGQALTQSQQQNSKIKRALKVKPEAELILIDTLITQAIYHPDEIEVIDDIKNPAVKAQKQQTEKEDLMSIALYMATDSVDIGKAIALAFDETLLQKNCVYQYRVGINDLNKTEDSRFIPESFSVSTDNWRSEESYPLLELTGEGKHNAFELKWKLSEENPYYYSSFYIERKKTSGSESFVRLNKTPLVYNANDKSKTILYEGTLPEDFVSYTFRIIGRTIFGKTIVASNEVVLSGYPDAMEERPFIENIKEVSTSQPGNKINPLTIKWRFPENKNSEIFGFEVWRSDSREGEFDKIAVGIPSNVREFTDPIPMRINFYVIVAKDKNNYELPSLPQVGYPSDEIPPAIPTGVKGVSDGNGNITISWEAVHDEDLQGYHVFWNNDKDGQFLPITSEATKNTNFNFSVDIKSLTEKTYFKVAAIDLRYNLSPFSPAAEVILPDIIPPTNPVIVGIEGVREGVKINYITSISEDVVKHELQRKADYEEYWDVISTISNTQKDSVFIDSLARPFVNYDYKLIAIDDANLKSESTTFSILNFKDGQRLSISNPYIYRDVAVLEQLKSANGLTSDICYMKVYWEYPEYAGIYDFQIYRSYKGSPFILVKSVAYNDALFRSTITINNLEQKKLGIVDVDVPSKQIEVKEGINPPLAPKKMRSFLSCDDDLSTTMQAITNPNDFKYQILVRFLDGTSSRFSVPISIK